MSRPTPPPTEKKTRKPAKNMEKATAGEVPPKVPPRKGSDAPRKGKGGEGARKGKAGEGARKGAEAAGAPRPALWRRLLPSPLTVLLALVMGAAAWLFLDVEELKHSPVASELRDGDMVLVDRLAPELDNFAAPQLVTVRHHEVRSEEVLARVVAWEGQRVRFKKGALLVGEQPFDLPAPLAPSPLVPDATTRGGLAEHFTAASGLTRPRRAARPRALGAPSSDFEVPRHHVFVLVASPRSPETLQGRLVPLGDVTGAARMVLTNLDQPGSWAPRLL